jgi:hypothetical protein
LDLDDFKCKRIDKKDLWEITDAVLSRVSPMLCKPFGVSTDVIEKRAEREGFWAPQL